VVPELRRDPLTDEWVVLAAERGRRPHEVGPAGRAVRDEREHAPDCPLCPGNEAQTPPPVLVQPASGQWRVRVVPNKFPIVGPVNRPPREPSDGLLASTAALGAHEVIVESPQHWRSIARMEPSEVELVLATYRERYRALGRAPWARYAVVFKNHGAGAGTSLAHPHSQLVALSAVPEPVGRRRALARAHRDRTGRLLYEDVLSEELRTGERVVAETDGFVVLCPFASRMPFELRISPRAPSPTFADVADHAIAELAAVLHDALACLDREAGDPDFNYVLHSALPGDAATDEVWRLDVVPRLATPAGFELGSGLGVNTLAPEDAAARLRRASPRPS
jgi:UDPglucose--hexose-1-phosphate uridylyltransferase